MDTIAMKPIPAWNGFCHFNGGEPLSSYRVAYLKGRRGTNLQFIHGIFLMYGLPEQFIALYGHEPRSRLTSPEVIRFRYAAPSLRAHAEARLQEPANTFTQ
jgi:hypothetical protein